MNYHWTYTPRPQSRTRRAELQQTIRRHLGTSSDGAASSRRTLAAAQQMVELVHLATDGKLTLVLEDQSGNRVPFSNAVGAASTDPDA